MVPKFIWGKNMTTLAKNVNFQSIQQVLLSSFGYYPLYM